MNFCPYTGKIPYPDAPRAEAARRAKEYDLGRALNGRLIISACEGRGHFHIGEAANYVPSPLPLHLKSKAVDLRGQGWAFVDIASELGISSTTVRALFYGRRPPRRNRVRRP